MWMRERTRKWKRKRERTWRRARTCKRTRKRKRFRLRCVKRWAQSIRQNRIPLEYARKQSMCIRSKALHWNTLESKRIRSKPLESIPRIRSAFRHHKDGQSVSIYSQHVIKTDQNPSKIFRNSVRRKWCVARWKRSVARCTWGPLHVALGPKSIQNRSKIDPRTFPEWGSSETRQAEQVENWIWMFFGTPLSDFGWPFGSGRVPRASQNRECWHQVALKSDKK